MPKTNDTPAPELALRSLGLREATLHALRDNGIDDIPGLLAPAHTRAVIAGWSGIGASRLADLDAAMGRAGLAYGKPPADRFAGSNQACKICPHCGNPRATSRRSVAVGLDGRAHNIGHRVGPTCDGCDKYHRDLVTAGN